MLDVRDGNLETLGVLFERHHRQLYTYFVRMTGGKRRISEDFVQEVFLRMLKYRKGYTGEGKFAVWMYRIARNVQIDYFKKWSRENTSAHDDGDQTDDSATSDEIIQQQEHVDVLKLALKNLAPDKREVLILSRFQSLKYEEIGALLGCSTNAVKVRAHRAMKELRTIFFQLTGEQVQ